MATIYDQVFKDELRNYCRCPKKFQLIDALGSALGTFFIIQNIRSLRQDAERTRTLDGWNVTGLLLGGIMFYIHTARFIYAADIKQKGKRRRDGRG